MGRPRKYHNDEQRKAAARERAKKYRLQKKAEQELMNIGLDVLPNSHMQVPHDVRQDAHNMIYGPSVDLYTKKKAKGLDLMNIGLDVLPNSHMQVPHEVRSEAHHVVFGPSTDLYKRKRTVEHNQYLKAKKQISDAYKCIKGVANINKTTQRGDTMFDFEWNDMDEDERNYMFTKLADVISKWSTLNNADSKWLIRYRFTDRAVVTKPMNHETASKLLSQLYKEGFLNSVTGEMAEYEASDYDYFPTGIKTLESLQFINADYSKLPKRKRREGGFWRWRLKVPIDLSAYQIFNRINKHTIEQMTTDNCIIYACIQSGLEDSIIKHMRQVFKNRFISITKVDRIGKECGVKFLIRTDSSTLTVGDKDSSVVVKLVLVNGHYMIDKDIALSPYYIRNYKKINSSSKAKAMPFNRRCLVSNVNLVVTSEAYDIVDVLSALFDINAFQPITQSDLMRYKTTLYQDVNEDTEAQPYDDRWCTRLKAPRVYNKKEVK